MDISNRPHIILNFKQYMRELKENGLNIYQIIKELEALFKV